MCVSVVLSFSLGEWWFVGLVRWVGGVEILRLKLDKNLVIVLS